MSHVLKCGVAALALITLAACSGKAKVREPAALVKIEQPQVETYRAWSAGTAGGSDGLATGLQLFLGEGAIYAAETDGRVFAFERDSGKRIWQQDTESRLIGGPSVFGDLVLLGSRDAEVVALQRADGVERWRRSISSEVLGAPVGAGDLIVARAVDGRVFGMAASSGDALWTFDRLVPNLVLRGLSTPLITGNSVVVGMENGRVAALNLSDGVALWEQPVTLPSGRTELERLVDIDADLIDGPRCIYAASFGGEVACLDRNSGQIIWRREIKTYSGMVLHGDKLVVTDEDGVVWGLDADSGAAAWKQESMKYRKLSAPAAFGAHLVVGDFKGYLHWIAADDGRLIGRSRAGSDPIVKAPLAGEELLYVLNVEGKVTALGIEAE
ncbi:MAG: outer membrane protein assembly factor BamB [Panacagrimonas sp.]